MGFKFLVSNCNRDACNCCVNSLVSKKDRRDLGKGPVHNVIINNSKNKLLSCLWIETLWPRHLTINETSLLYLEKWSRQNILTPFNGSNCPHTERTVIFWRANSISAIKESCLSWLLEVETKLCDFCSEA